MTLPHALLRRALAALALIPTTCATRAVAQPRPCLTPCACYAGTPTTTAARISGQPDSVRVIVPAKGNPHDGLPLRRVWVERAGVCLGVVAYTTTGTATACRYLPDRAPFDPATLRRCIGAPYAATYASRATAVRWLWRTTPVPSLVPSPEF